MLTILIEINKMEIKILSPELSSIYTNRQINKESQSVGSSKSRPGP